MKRRLVVWLVVFVVVLVGVAAAYYLRLKLPYKKIGTKTVTIAEHDKFVKEAKNFKNTSGQADDTLTECTKLEQIARQNNVSEDQIKTVLSEVGSNPFATQSFDAKQTDSNPDYVRCVLREAAIKQVLKPHIEGQADGAVIHISFSQHLGQDSKLIAQDKQKAEVYANSLYSQLVAGQLTSAQAVQASLKEKSVAPLNGLPLSMTFDANRWQNSVGILQWPGVKDQIRKSELGVSKPLVMQAYYYDEQKKTNNLVDAYYGIFIITSRSADPRDFDTYLKTQLDNIGVTK